MKATTSPKRGQRDFELLRNRSSSPYPPAAPKKSVFVNLIMSASSRRGQGGLTSPHLYGGSNMAKVMCEYNGADLFWFDLDGRVTAEIFDGKDVLDVGCGWGGKAIHFAEHTKLKSIAGFDLPGVFDPAAAMQLARQKKLDNCVFTTGYAESIPFPDEQFDVVLSEDVLEHVADPEQAITECHRVLRPGGRLVAKFPSFKSMKAHHLDRALSLPGLHYALPIATWASGLNYLLLDPKNGLSFEPFDEVVTTKYRKGVTRNLNGMDFEQFSDIVRRSPLRPSIFTLVPFNTAQGRPSFKKSIYNSIFQLGALREFLAYFVLLVAEKP